MQPKVIFNSMVNVKMTWGKYSLCLLLLNLRKKPAMVRGILIFCPISICHTLIWNRFDTLWGQNPPPKVNQRFCGHINYCNYLHWLTWANIKTENWQLCSRQPHNKYETV